jgi:8-oxo-dGTP diphosphatase
VGDSPQSPARPILAVGAVVVDRYGRVLLIRRARNPAAGTWTIPGGRVEPGETVAVAVVRELREETSLDARVIDCLGLETVTADDVTYAIHEHLLVPVGDRPPQAGDDASEVRWAAIADIAGLGVRKEVIVVLERAIARAHSLGYVRDVSPDLL